MAIIDRAVEEYNGVLRWKNRQVSKFQPKSELGLGIKKRALMLGNRKNRNLGPRQRIGRFQEPARQPLTDVMPSETPTSSTGSFKLIGSR